MQTLAHWSLARSLALDRKLEWKQIVWLSVLNFGWVEKFIRKLFTFIYYKIELLGMCRICIWPAASNNELLIKYYKFTRTNSKCLNFMILFSLDQINASTTKIQQQGRHNWKFAIEANKKKLKIFVDHSKYAEIVIMEIENGLCLYLSLSNHSLLLLLLCISFAQCLFHRM